MSKIRLKGLIEEDFLNYRLPSMFLATCFCDFKCEKEDSTGVTFCQNSSLARAPIIETEIKTLIDKYINNPISKAIVVGGMEPFSQFEELTNLIKEFRIYTKDPFVIYTGYDSNEICEQVESLIPYGNIIVKYGRYKCNNPGRYDGVLGIHLASDNQYACYYGRFFDENANKS